MISVLWNMILNSNLISSIIVFTELCLLLTIKFSTSLSIIIFGSCFEQLILVSSLTSILLKFLIFKLLQAKTHLIILLLILVLRVLLINFLSLLIDLYLLIFLIISVSTDKVIFLLRYLFNEEMLLL